MIKTQHQLRSEMTDFKCQSIKKINTNEAVFGNQREPPVEIEKGDTIQKKSQNLKENLARILSVEHLKDLNEKNSNFSSKNQKIATHLKIVLEIPKNSPKTGRKLKNQFQKPVRNKKINTKNLKFTADGKVICEHCYKPVEKVYYKHHIQRLHLQVKNFTCDYCDKQFYKRDSLVSHMHIHLQTRPFACSHAECTKAFLSTTALATHFRFHHTNFSQYVCENCGKGYKQKRLLEEHMRSKHTGERVFKCDREKCDAAFFSMSSMRRHWKSHENGEVTCEMCGKKFRSLNALMAHARLVHVEVIICEIDACGKEFQSKCYLKNHQKHSHGIANQTKKQKVDAEVFNEYFVEQLDHDHI